ncbi:MAG: hypothetical protein HYV18_00080 [Gammaproteobacteria bacterium]|nr:hypothetical protein [Gammaproteobacteria bacterium]
MSIERDRAGRHSVAVPQRPQAEGANADREFVAFCSSVSHDLRTSLSAIDGLSQALLEDCGEKLGEHGRGHVRDIRDCLSQMRQVTDGLMALARVCGSELHCERVDLSRLARQLGARLGAERAVDFVVQDGLFAQGDPRLLRIALENLLRNAWKFTARQPRARIEVGGEVRDGATEFFVRDNGVGFDMAQADRLFLAFQRLHPSAEFEGHGLGLATVRRIVGRHGGSIRAVGRVDAGAAFYFTLGPAPRSGRGAAGEGSRSAADPACEAAP